MVLIENWAEVRVGSDSDLPKIAVLLEELKKIKVQDVERILSAHRTPDKMALAAQDFPEIKCEEISRMVDWSKINIKLCFAAAGGSAHIAGMTAAETNIPVIAIPVSGSAMDKMDSTLSMLNMPPGVPNGFISDYKAAANIGGRIMNLKEEDIQRIFVPKHIQALLDSLILEFGVEITNDINNATIGIHMHNLIEPISQKLCAIPIIIPTETEKVNYDNIGQVMRNIDSMPGLAMGVQLEEKINATNAFIYCMKLFATLNPKIDQLLTKYRQELGGGVIIKDKNLVNNQIESGKFDHLLDVKLPDRYNHVHGGKVRETYENPDNPDQLIMIATDRISTHDVVHRNRIPGKGKSLTQISNFWFSYFKTQEATKDIPTQQILDADFPTDFPEHLKSQAIIVKKLHPLPVEAIVRNYLFGSAYKDKNGKGYNAQTGKLVTGEYIGKELVSGSEFPEPLFTPSTKDKNDTNINFEDMAEEIRKYLENKYPEFKSRSQEYADTIKKYSLNMFTTGREYAKTKGIIIADTKFEFAIDENGVLHIIDEVLTPDSSRFRKAEGYQTGKEPIAFDKQPVRDYVMKEWKENNTKDTPVIISNEAIADTQIRYQEMEFLFSTN